MKKLFISLLAIAATMNAMAIEYNTVAKLTLNSQGGYNCEMTLKQSADANASKYCAPLNMTNRVIALYTINGTGKSQIFVANDLEGAALGLITNEDTEYTINFSNVSGEKLYLVDAVANKTTEITEGGSYAFTAEANQTIADRFSITKVLPALPYSFINNTLVITEATEGAEVTITPFTYGPQGKALGDPIIAHAPVNEVLTGGYYLVSYTNAEGVAREFIVNANPDVQPAND